MIPPNRPTRRNRRDALRLTLGLSSLAVGALAGGAGAFTAHEGQGVASTVPGHAAPWRERLLIGFGSTLWLRASHPDVARLDRALDAAVLELRDIEAALSLFDPDSALSRLNRQGRLGRPDRHLWSVVAAATAVSRASAGAFDATVQPLWDCWSQAARSGSLPTATALARARARVGWQHVRADADVIRFERPGMAMTLNGIAQGYAADRVAAILRAHGITDAIVDTGEWATRGSPAPSGPWRLGLENPFDPERLLGALALPPDGCVATSSFTHQTFTADGSRHHIIDPRSGLSPPHVATVAVVAKSAMLADALTKVLFMATPRTGLKIARHWGARAAIVDRAGALHLSPGLALIPVTVRTG